MTPKAKNKRSKRLPMYNSRGVLRETGEDLCDCLDKSCDGCHFPCESCGSPKCLQCRVNRDWRYDTINLDGSENYVNLANDKKRKRKN